MSYLTSMQRSISLEFRSWEGGQVKFSKEEKQDLMHVAVCHLLSEEGYYSFEGMDADGWPHWKVLMPIDIKGLGPQETLLRRKVVEYFAPLLSNQEKT